MTAIVLGAAMIVTVVDHRDLQCKEEPVRLYGGKCRQLVKQRADTSVSRY